HQRRRRARPACRSPAATPTASTCSPARRPTASSPPSPASSAKADRVKLARAILRRDSVDGSADGEREGMAQEHLDRLTAIDASFLAQEGPTSHMHVGGLAEFEGPPPPYTELLDVLRGRLHLVPRYRQKLSVPPAGTGRPLWIDDPNFSLEYHVRHTALPKPGDEPQLLRL